MPEDIRYEIEDLTSEAGRLLDIALKAGQVRALEAPAIPAEFDEQLDAACAGLIGLAAPRLALVHARLAVLVALPQEGGGEQPVSVAPGGFPLDAQPEPDTSLQPSEGALPPVQPDPAAPAEQAPAPALEG